MKKILILTVTAGGGHNSAAQAMREKLETDGNEVKVADMFAEFSSNYRRWAIDRGYCIAVSRFRRLYNAFYEKYRSLSYEKSLISSEQRMLRGVYGGLLKLIYDYRPDVIYCTSFHCAVAITNLKRAFTIPAKIVAVMLDYVVSPFWECAADGIDKIGIPDGSFYDELIFRGFNFMQIKRTGIPVKCGGGLDRNAARQALGFRDDRFTVLVMFGGGYWKGAYAAFKAIASGVKKPIRIIVVNGADKKGRKKIEKRVGRLPNTIEVINLGFSERVPELMCASDVMVGKGGGLTVTESINCRLPLIATAKLAGQENYNVQFLTERGAALRYSCGRELVKLVNDYMDDPARLEAVRRKLSVLATDGLGELAIVITELPKADYGGIANADYSRVNRLVESKRKLAYKHEKILRRYEKYQNMQPV